MQQTLTVINVVEDYSADRTGANDTSDQINNALAAVPVGGQTNVAAGAIVYFPRGTYLINKPLVRKASFTRCVGEGKSATIIKLDFATWLGTVSLADPVGSFMFDLASTSVTDCAVTDLWIDGSAGSLLQTNGTKSVNYSGILCSARDEIARVRLHDVWGYGLWIFGQKAANATVIDCDADLGSNRNATTRPGGNDCIGGGALRAKIVRFYWMPTLAKNTALDFANGGGSLVNPPHETSVDLVDCTNESNCDVVLEGCVQSSVRGCRFYGSSLFIKSDAAYPHQTITNPADILVADSLFMGGVNTLSQLVGGSCVVYFDGGAYCPHDTRQVYPGGRVAILGNTFLNSASSAIKWAGDDGYAAPNPTSMGGSVISGNRISQPNKAGTVSDVTRVPGNCGDLGALYPCGISVLSSYGLTIGRNTIDDPAGLMAYSMQLISPTSDPLPQNATTARILVTENLCGTTPGRGGVKGTFFFAGMLGAPNPSDAQPVPILHRNTNQDAGYDMAASTQISSGPSTGAPWPLAGGYPYDAIVTISGGSGVEIDLGVTDTKLQQGAFFLQAGQHINIKWGATEPIIKVFRV